MIKHLKPRNKFQVFFNRIKDKISNIVKGKPKYTVHRYATQIINGQPVNIISYTLDEIR